MNPWAAKKLLKLTLALVSGSLILSLGAGLLVSWNERETKYASWLSEMERQRTYRVKGFQDWLASQGQRLKLFELQMDAPPEALKSRLEAFSHALSAVTRLHLFSSRLSLIHSTGPRDLPLSWSGEEWLQRGSRTFTFSPAFAAAGTGAPLIRIAVPLRNRELKTEYILSAELNLQEAGLSFSRQLKSDEFAYAVLPGRTWLFRPPSIQELPIFQEPDDIDLALSGESFSGSYRNFRDFPVVGTYYFDQDLHAAFFSEKIIPPWYPSEALKGLWLLGIFLPLSLLVILLHFRRLGAWSRWMFLLGEPGKENWDDLPSLGKSWKDVEAPLRKALNRLSGKAGELERNNQEWQMLLDALPDLTAEISADGTILRTGKSGLSLLDLDHREPEGRKINQFVPDLEPLEDKLPLVLHAPRGHRFYSWIQVKNGSKRMIETIPSRTSGPPVRYFLSVRDVTERFMTGESVRQQKKMESLFNFSAGVVQDFSNLLAGISGRLSLAALDAERGLVDKESLNEAQRMIMDARSLTQDLVTVGSGGVYDLKPLDVLPVLQSAVDRARSQGLKVFVNLLPHHGMVKTDPSKLEVIFQEILDNARDFAGTEKPVRITSDLVMVPSTDAQVPDGRFLRISFLDQGPGIPLENLEKIYDPYFTTRQGKKGLGLTVVYSQLRRMGGSVEIESEEGSGTEVRIYFPASDAE